MSEEQEPAQEVERDYVAEATKDGWNPDYEGKNAKSAQEFVESGEKITGIAVAKARKLETQLETLQSKIEDIERTKGEFVEFNKRALEKERSEKAALVLHQKQTQNIKLT